MKWRDWQLLIILALLFYIAVTVALNIPRRPSSTAKDAPPLPSQTLRPTVESAATAPTTSIASPTSTQPPTKPPIPATTETATALPAATATSTPTVSPEPQPTATPTVGTITHTVQRGDNLTGLAKRYGTTIKAIVKANGLANPDVIYIGQKLIVPLPAQPSPTATPSG